MGPVAFQLQVVALGCTTAVRTYTIEQALASWHTTPPRLTRAASLAKSADPATDASDAARCGPPSRSLISSIDLQHDLLPQLDLLPLLTSCKQIWQAQPLLLPPPLSRLWSNTSALNSPDMFLRPRQALLHAHCSSACRAPKVQERHTSR